MVKVVALMGKMGGLMLKIEVLMVKMDLIVKMEALPVKTMDLMVKTEAFMVKMLAPVAARMSVALVARTAEVATVAKMAVPMAKLTATKQSEVVPQAGPLPPMSRAELVVVARALMMAKGMRGMLVVLKARAVGSHRVPRSLTEHMGKV